MIEIYFVSNSISSFPHRISEPYPLGCNTPESQVECIRGAVNNHLYWIPLHSLYFACIFYIFVSMFVTFKYVRNIEEDAARYTYVGRDLYRSRRVMTQGILYCITMLLVGFSIFNSTIGMDKLDITLSMAVAALQGVFNTSIYLLRRMLRRRQKNSNKKKKRKINCTKVQPPIGIYYEEKKKTQTTGGHVKQEGEKREIATSDNNVEQNESGEILAHNPFHPEPHIEEGNGEDDNVLVIDNNESSNDTDNESDNDYFGSQCVCTKGLCTHAHTTEVITFSS